MPLLAIRSRFSSTSFNGSFATSTAFTNRCSPLSTSVTRIATRHEARSAFNACKTLSFTSAHLFDIHADSAAARQTYFPRRLIGHAEFQHLWFSAVDHVHRLGHDCAFDTAA